MLRLNKDVRDCKYVDMLLAIAGLTGTNDNIRVVQGGGENFSGELRRDHLTYLSARLVAKKTGNENFPNVNLVLSICQLIAYLTIPIT
jgi:hypothetical protein